MRIDRESIYILMKNLTEKMGLLTTHRAKSYDSIDRLEECQTQLADWQQLIYILERLSN